MNYVARLFSSDMKVMFLDGNHQANDHGFIHHRIGALSVLTDDKRMIEYFLSLPIHDAPGGYTGRRAEIESTLTP